MEPWEAASFSELKHIHTHTDKNYNAGAQSSFAVGGTRCSTEDLLGFASASAEQLEPHGVQFILEEPVLCGRRRGPIRVLAPQGKTKYGFIIEWSENGGAGFLLAQASHSVCVV